MRHRPYIKTPNMNEPNPKSLTFLFLTGMLLVCGFGLLITAIIVSFMVVGILDVPFWFVVFGVLWLLMYFRFTDEV